MPTVPEFDDFYQQALALFQDSPLTTRYVVKFKGDRLTLTVTDDKTVRWTVAPSQRSLLPRWRLKQCPQPRPQCLKYKTDQQADLRKLERLTTALFPLMACGEAPAEGRLFRRS
jgi:signal recognition particle subunit SRP9